MSEKKGSAGNKVLHCSFCNKSQHEVRKLIAGPSVFVCDECIDLCNDIIREEAQANARASIRNELPTDSYSLLNLRLSHSWDAIRVDVGVENLLDEFYFLPAGGTYVGQGMTMSFNAIPFGIGVPGMGRSLYAGVNYSF